MMPKFWQRATQPRQCRSRGARLSAAVCDERSAALVRPSGRSARRRACEVATAMRFAWNGLKATCAQSNSRAGAPA
jgi:hypothetical protein